MIGHETVGLKEANGQAIKAGEKPTPLVHQISDTACHATAFYPR